MQAHSVVPAFDATTAGSAIVVDQIPSQSLTQFLISFKKLASLDPTLPLPNIPKRNSLDESLRMERWLTSPFCDFVPDWWSARWGTEFQWGGDGESLPPQVL